LAVFSAQFELAVFCETSCFLSTCKNGFWQYRKTQILTY